MRILSDTILNLTSLTTTTSEIVSLAHECLWSIQFIWTGTTTGVVSVNVSNNGINWVPYTTFEQTLTQPAGTPGTTIAIPRVNAGYGYIQTVYTHTSGTGTLKAIIFAKGF